MSSLAAFYYLIQLNQVNLRHSINLNQYNQQLTGHKASHVHEEVNLFAFDLLPCNIHSMDMYTSSVKVLVPSRNIYSGRFMCFSLSMDRRYKILIMLLL